MEFAATSFNIFSAEGDGFSVLDERGITMSYKKGLKSEQ